MLEDKSQTGCLMAHVEHPLQPLSSAPDKSALFLADYFEEVLLSWQLMQLGKIPPEEEFDCGLFSVQRKKYQQKRELITKLKRLKKERICTLHHFAITHDGRELLYMWLFIVYCFTILHMDYSSKYNTVIAQQW